MSGSSFLKRGGRGVGVVREESSYLAEVVNSAGQSHAVCVNIHVLIYTYFLPNSFKIENLIWVANTLENEKLFRSEKYSLCKHISSYFFLFTVKSLTRRLRFPLQEDSSFEDRVFNKTSSSTFYRPFPVAGLPAFQLTLGWIIHSQVEPCVLSHLCNGL